MSAVYYYTARALDGAFVSGSLRVESRNAAIDMLRNRALFVTSVEASGTARGTLAAALTLGGHDPRVRTVFFRSFATMISAGVSMKPALDVAIDQCRHARFRETLRAVAGDVEGGTALSEAMARRPKDFSPLIVAMVRAGERGGVLPSVLDRIADLLERHHNLQRRLRAAMAYPAVVCVAALGLVMFLIANIVPAFATMFAQIHVDLPLTTRILIATGRALDKPGTWVGMGAGVVASISGYRSLIQLPVAARRIDALVLAAPVIGSLLRKAAVARLTRTLGTQLRSGVPLASAIEACSGVVGAPSYERQIPDIADALRNGIALGIAFERTGMFDSLVLALLRCGEETGTLDAMLMRVAEHYDVEVETTVAALSSVIEPLLIVVLGAVVGTIVGSILIPLYSIIGSIK